MVPAGPTLKFFHRITKPDEIQNVFKLLCRSFTIVLTQNSFKFVGPSGQPLPRHDKNLSMCYKAMFEKEYSN